MCVCDKRLEGKEEIYKLSNKTGKEGRGKSRTKENQK